MVKYYKLKSPVWTYWAGDIFVLKDDGNLWYLGNEDKTQNELEKKLHWKGEHIAANGRTLENFNILSNWFEEIGLKDIDNVAGLLPYEGMECYTLKKIEGEIKIIRYIWRSRDNTKGMFFIDKEKAIKVAKAIKLINCGFYIESVEQQKNIGKVIVTGRYFAEKSNEVEEILTDCMRLREEI